VGLLIRFVVHVIVVYVVYIALLVLGTRKQ
jgi:hypothetical protein